MNILLLTHIYPDRINRWRGAFVREQALALSKTNDVVVVFFKIDYSVFAPFESYRFSKRMSNRLTEYEVVVPKSFPIINQVKSFKETFRFIKTEILKEYHPEIIHSHLSYPAGFFGTIMQRILGIPNIITEHSWIHKHFRSIVHKLCVLYAIKNSKGYITVSEALKNDILKYYKRPINVIPNVINTEQFFISGKSEGKEFNIGILGGMSNYRKGLDIFIRAIPRVVGIKVIAHVGGTGILIDEFIRLSEEMGVRENFRFYGEIATEGLPDFYSRQNAFVLASRDETFGVVIVEAMSSGLPVIATDCGGPREIITNQTGLLINKEDPEKLAEAITYMARNLNQFKPETIRSYAVENFGYDAFNSRMTSLYRSLQ